MLVMSHLFCGSLCAPTTRQTDALIRAAELINNDPELKKALLHRFLESQISSAPSEHEGQDNSPPPNYLNDAPLGKAAQHAPVELKCSGFSSSPPPNDDGKDWTRSPRTLWSLDAAEQWLRPDMEPMPDSSEGTLPRADQLACALQVSRSQFREDLVLLPYLLHMTGYRPGTFVEIGAYDGIKYSNTIALELCFGWTGLLIEANPNNFAALTAAQQQYRVRSKIRHAAICKQLGGTVNMTVQGGAVAGQPSRMSPRYLKQWGHLNHPEQTVQVPCAPMAVIMAEAGLQRANLLSLDVEGAELDVLETTAAEAFDLVLVEMDGHNLEKDRRVHCLLESWGLQRKTAFPFGSIFHSHVYVRSHASSPSRSVP